MKNFENIEPVNQAQAVDTLLSKIDTWYELYVEWVHQMEACVNNNQKAISMFCENENGLKPIIEAHNLVPQLDS